MGQLLIRQLDDAKLERLKRRARDRNMSTEAFARETLHAVASELTVEEKREIVRAMRETGRLARIPGVAQTPGLDLIRESRNDH